MPRPYLITHDGQTLTRQEWADRLGIPVETIAWRHREGMDPAKILSPRHLPRGGDAGSRPDSDLSSAKRARRPRNQCRPRFAERTFLTFEGETRTIAEWAFILGLTESVIKQRLSRQIPIADVLSTAILRTRGSGILKGREADVEKQKGPRIIYARRTVLTFAGQSMTVEDWGREIAVPFTVILSKLNAGEPIAACLAKVSRPRAVREESAEASPASPRLRKRAKAGALIPRMRVPTLAELDAMLRAA